MENPIQRGLEDLFKNYKLRCYRNVFWHAETLIQMIRVITIVARAGRRKPCKGRMNLLRAQARGKMPTAL